MHEYPYIHEKGKLPRTLARIDFLSDLNPEALDGILTNSSLVEAFSGETILSEGDEAGEFYFLLKGSVQVSKEGRQIALIDQQGELLGELSALKGETRSASLTAATPCFLLKVDPKFLDELSDTERSAYHLILYRFLTELLTRRLADTSARVAELEKQLGL
ncbi:Crp/Fnr family transcriptional regulator [Haloferula sp.]|uniref:Crp/Fnr family transcriptional regulator n=1 Tax=Haloferula sp. TaxID=2497595 RepID=UPI00329CF2B3